jgi:hypothetical protein
VISISLVFEGRFALSEAVLLIGVGVKRARGEDLTNCSSLRRGRR